jgi:sec-independent protein translocase protein TatC
VARQVGGAWRSFNEFRHRMESEVRNTMPDLPPTSEIARLARSPSALLNHLSNMSSDEAPDGSADAAVREPPRCRGRRGRPSEHPLLRPGPPQERTQRPHRRPSTAPHRTGTEPRRTPAAGPPAVRRGRSRRPDPELNDTTVVTLPFTGKRKSRPSPDSMTLGEHLGELRRRVIICVIAFVIAATIAVNRLRADPALPVASAVQRGRQRPAPHGQGASSLLVASNGSCNLFVTSPLDGLSLRVKIALFGGLVLASPVILFQIWRFVTPGLKARTAVRHPFVSSAFVLFLLGAATAYITLPHALGWLKSVGGPNLQAIYDPIPYLGLILLMMTIFGLTFEFPVVLVSLELARRGDAGAPAPHLALGGHHHRGGRRRLHPELGPLLHARARLPLVVFYFLSIGIGKLLGR